MQVGDVDTYLEHGPGFLFLFHPALGPLWEVIAQNLRGGQVIPRSELILEVCPAPSAVLPAAARCCLTHYTSFTASTMPYTELPCCSSACSRRL